MQHSMWVDLSVTVDQNFSKKPLGFFFQVGKMPERSEKVLGPYTSQCHLCMESISSMRFSVWRNLTKDVSLSLYCKELLTGTLHASKSVHFLPCLIYLCLNQQGLLLHPRHFGFTSDISVSLIKLKYSLLPDYIWIEFYILVVKRKVGLWADDDVKCFCI